MGLFKNLLRKRDTQADASSREGTSDKSSYAGVQINTDGSSCCQAAKAILGKRFLSENVPMLPLADCDAVDCRCTYQRFDDRRTDSRRASDVAFDVVGQFHEDENRSGDSPGRRDDD